MLFRTDATVIAAVLILAMLLAAWLGHRAGVRLPRRSESGERRGLGATEGGLLALFGLLLAFTFNLAANKFEDRRRLLVDEANAIGTAVLCADLYPDAERTMFRRGFSDYLEARIAYHEAGADFERTLATLATAGALQRSLWGHAALLAREPANLVASYRMLPSLNSMIDLQGSRLAALRSRVPDIIVWLLLALAVVCSFMIGYGAGLNRVFDWLGVSGFALVTAVVIHVTLDLDRPRRGMIRLDEPHQSMLDLRSMFSGGPR